MDNNILFQYRNPGHGPGQSPMGLIHSRVLSAEFFIVLTYVTGKLKLSTLIKNFEIAGLRREGSN
jgi:hypothetical protein